MQLSKAFSLIELLVVVAIVAILSAVAIPSYSTYIVKARILELLTVADAYKLKLADNLFGVNQASVEELNTSLIDKVIVKTIYGQPTIHVIQVVAKMQSAETAGIGIAQPATAAGALTIQMQGRVVGELISWTCNVEAGYNQYVPQSCQTNALLDLT